MNKEETNIEEMLSILQKEYGRKGYGFEALFQDNQPLLLSDILKALSDKEIIWEMNNKYLAVDVYIFEINLSEPLFEKQDDKTIEGIFRLLTQ